MKDFLRDAGYACRLLRRTPVFAVVAAGTLAAGIGSGTTVFSLVNAALFRPIYAERPHELVEVVAGRPDGGAYSGHSYINYVDYRAGSGETLAGLAAFLPYSASIGTGTRTERASVGLVSDNYFGVLGIHPLAGRAFRPDENETPGAHFVAVISESLWRREFGGSTAAVGARLGINNTPYTVIGVVPERAARMMNVIKVDVFVPAVMQGPVRGTRHWLHERGNREFSVVGRLRRDVPLAAAKARFAAIGEQLQRAYPEAWVGRDGPIPLSIVPATTAGRELRGYLTGAAALVMAAVACLALIVCANLANLLLARTTDRRQEIAVRFALGASRARVVRQLLVEALVLAAVGAAGGMLLAIWARSLLNALVPSFGVPLVVDLTLDYRVLAFSVALTLLTTIASSLAPALMGTRLQAGLRPARSRPRNALMVAQVAVSLTLLMCAGMFIRTLAKVQAIDPGFDSQRVAILSISPGGRGYTPTEGRRFVERLSARLAQMPGVEAVAVAARAPMSLSRARMEVSTGAGQSAGELYAAFNVVSDRYFETMRIPMARGREFDSRDGDGAPPVAIVNERLAATLWGGSEAVGQQIRLEGGRVAEVIGVAADSKYESLTEATLPFVYLPLAQNHRPGLTIHARTRTAPAAVLDPLRREVLAVDPLMAVFDVQTLDAHLADSLLPLRSGSAVIGALGAMALALASLGLYGVMAYSVSRRTRELGIRMALGSTPGAARRLVIRQGMALTGAGILLGLLGGSSITAVIATELHGVTPADVATLAAVAGAQASVAFLACWIPASRASRIDPMAALRES